MLSRRRFLWSIAKASGLGLAGGSGVSLYAWLWEPHWLQVVNRDLPIANLPDRLVGTTLVQLSDLHIGPRVDDHYMIRALDTAKKLAPDFIVYTGDFTDHEPEIVTHAHRMFPNLAKGRRATIGILGNHDYGSRWSHPSRAAELAEAATDAGVTILCNSIAIADGLQVVGMGDLWAGQFDPRRALRNFNPRLPSIALSHNPDTVDLPGWDGYSGWILAGHTHGGQCKPPFLPPPILPVKNRRYTAGTFQLDRDRKMYINRGVGHLAQVRFNVRPEITRFRLQRLGNV